MKLPTIISKPRKKNTGLIIIFIMVFISFMTEMYMQHKTDNKQLDLLIERNNAISSIENIRREAVNLIRLTTQHILIKDRKIMGGLDSMIETSIANLYNNHEYFQNHFSPADGIILPRSVSNFVVDFDNNWNKEVRPLSISNEDGLAMDALDRVVKIKYHNILLALSLVQESTISNFDMRILDLSVKKNSSKVTLMVLGVIFLVASVTLSIGFSDKLEKSLIELESSNKTLNLHLNHLATIHTAGQHLQRLDQPRDLAEKIINLLENIASYELGAVLLVEQETGKMIPFAISDQGKGKEFQELDGEYITSHGIRVGHGIVGWVAEHGETILSGNVTADPRYYPLRKDIHSELCVPLKIRDQVIGVINIETGEYDAYKDIDKIVLETIASQIAVAVTNSNMHNEIKRYTHELERKVADLKRSEKEKEQSLQEAQNANNVKDLFLANISHEVRTPINSILGFTEIIELELLERFNEEEREYFNVIRMSCQRLINTIHSILDISQIEAGIVPFNPQEIRLSPAVEVIYKEFQHVAAAKNLDFQFNNLIRDDIVILDEETFTQSVTNLVENAIKYTEKGHVNIELREEESKYVLSISDTGIGIDENYIDQMYDVFTQESTGYTKNYQGLGLGLSIAKRYLDMNDIAIEVESKPGRGTAFRLIFTPADAVIDDPETKENPAVAGVAKAAGKEKPEILIVEDDKNNRMALEIILQEEYEYPSAVSVDQAKTQLRKYDIDLILLDLSLQGDEDGLDLVRYMKGKKEFKDIPIIAVTAHAFNTDRARALEAGCDEYIPKPYDMKKLLEMIDAFLA